MPTTARPLELRIEKLEEVLGLLGLGTTKTLEEIVTSVEETRPVGSLYISSEDSSVTLFGTWELLDSGNLLGGTVGKVYIWKRTE